MLNGLNYLECRRPCYTLAQRSEPHNEKAPTYRSNPIDTAYSGILASSTQLTIFHFLQDLYRSLHSVCIWILPIINQSHLALHSVLSKLTYLIRFLEVDMAYSVWHSIIVWKLNFLWGNRILGMRSIWHCNGRVRLSRQVCLNIRCLCL